MVFFLLRKVVVPRTKKPVKIFFPRIIPEPCMLSVVADYGAIEMEST
jgi:hypothetical protein